MPWLRALGPITFVIAIVVVIAGAGVWGRPTALALIRVADVAPHDVERGDRLVVTGEGFPPGRAARIAFRGTLHRPGERPQGGVEILASGLAVGPQRVELLFGESLEGLFCRTGDRAIHTTFEGEVEVAFAAAAAAEPPVAGVLRGVAIDVVPTERSSDPTRQAEGGRLATFLGLNLGHGRAIAGLAVEGVLAGSAADAAGIAPGDLLTQIDGVRAAGLGDLVPAPGERNLTVKVRRAGVSSEIPRVISIAAFRGELPADLLASALVSLGALCVVLFFAAPLPSAVERALWPLWVGLRRRDRTLGSRGASPTARLMRTWIDAAKRALPPAGATAFIDLGVCAALGMMPFGQYLIAAKLDVGLLFVVAIAGLASTAVAASGSFTGRGLRAAAHVVWQHAPAAVALSSVVVVAGSLRVRDIVRAQGGWPWEWLSFRSPASLVALGLVLACARVAAPRPHPSRATNAWVAASVRAHGLVVAGLAAALFLGGWSLPGLSAAQQDSRPALEMAGAACFMVKVATVSVALSWWRWAVPPANHVAAARSTLLWQLPSAIATLVATAAWTWLEPSAAAQGFASGALTLICVVAIAALGDRLRQALASPTADGHLDAFL